MNMDPFLQTSLAIKIHLVSATLAFFLGSVLLWRRKGSLRHKQLGKIWVILMATVILSSVFISELKTIGPFSGVHLLTVFSAFGMIYALIQIRKGNIKHHQRAMQGLFFGGLVVAGSMAFAPNRVLHRMFFSDGAFTGPGTLSPTALALSSAVIAGLAIYVWHYLSAKRQHTE